MTVAMIAVRIRVGVETRIRSIRCVVPSLVVKGVRMTRTEFPKPLTPRVIPQ